MKKDDTVRNLLESKFDRETLAVLLGIDKEIPKYCNAVITLTLLLKPRMTFKSWTLSAVMKKYKILKKR
jgi:hypothetical protein